ncbi:MAG: SipW-dependent-type signal peptide-containing protein [Clostridia bacterium]
MKRSSTTKKALFISTCALLFSMLMMAGSTFAWFTDSVSTGTNTITTGKLDVQLLHTNQHVTPAKEVGQDTLLFTDEGGNPIDWEPGAIAYENFTVENSGDLALNYRLALDLNNANTIAGTNRSLKDVLKVKVVKGGVKAADVSENALQGAEGFVSVTNGQISIPEAVHDDKIQKLTKKGSKGSSSDTYGVIIYWQPNPEQDYKYNLANYSDTDKDGKTIDNTSDGNDHLTIDLGVSLGATQAPEESDSNGSDYDREATYPAASVNEFTSALEKAKSGDTIELTGSISLNEPITVNKNVTIKSVGGAVLSGEALEIGSNADVTLQGITFKSPRTAENKGISLKATGYNGKLVIDSCTFEEPQWSSIDITAKASASITIKNCSFNVPEASNSAGHKYDSSTCKSTTDGTRNNASSSKLAMGAHSMLCITGADGTSLVMTGNTFNGLANCDASEAIKITRISGAEQEFEKNTVDQKKNISIQNNSSRKGFAVK